MVSNPLWLQVFKLRSGQTKHGLAKIMPLLATHSRHHKQWLGTGFYLWDNYKNAEGWAQFQYKCDNSSLVFASYRLGILPEEIFDPKENLEHSKIFTAAAQEVLNQSRLLKGQTFRGSDFFYGDIIMALNEFGILTDFGFKATVSRETYPSSLAPIKIKMSPRTTPWAQFFRTQICVFAEFGEEIEKSGVTADPDVN